MQIPTMMIWCTTVIVALSMTIFGRLGKQQLGKVKKTRGSTSFFALCSQRFGACTNYVATYQQDVKRDGKLNCSVPEQKFEIILEQIIDKSEVEFGN